MGLLVYSSIFFVIIGLKFVDWKLTCSPFGQIQGGCTEVDGLASTFAVARVYVDVVGGPRLEISDRERCHFARLIVNRGARFRGCAACSRLTVHLYRELLRQTTVEPLDALHVQRVYCLVQKRAIARCVRVTCEVE